jgi:hypothetical protein
VEKLQTYNARVSSCAKKQVLDNGRPSPIGSLEGSILKLNNDAVFHGIIVA